MRSQSTALSLDSSSAIVDKAGLKEPGSKNSPNLYYSFKTKEKLFFFQYADLAVKLPGEHFATY